MKFVSTRGQSPAVSISEAIRHGGAPDGGLYIPAQPLRVDPAELDPEASLAANAAKMLRPYFEGDPLLDQLEAICAEALDLPTPVVASDPGRPNLRLLELFHGPTGAFKDFGARFLMACFDRLTEASAPLTVLVATSGDTGGAVSCAAEGRRGVRSVVLFPKGRVSPFQRRQLTCWSAPSLSLEVEADFDACQALVKAAFADPDLGARHRLTSANSINVARLLAQLAYIGHAAVQSFHENGVAPGLVIPTGNLGHGLAALWARGLGLPVGPIIAATNVNRSLYDWYRTGDYRPAPSIQTIANAMDVGAPSNFERLRALSPESYDLRVESVDDAAIRDRIRQQYRETSYILCPHSAAAMEAWHRLDGATQDARPWLVAATAHPYKFAEVVEPLIERELAPPAALAAILGRPERSQPIDATLDALAQAIGQPLPADAGLEAAA